VSTYKYTGISEGVEAGI